MSILIRDMEMPTSCAECRFCVNGFTEKAPLYECACESTNGTSVPVDYGGKPFEFRPNWCPLEEVAECGDAVSREKVKELAYSQIRSEYSGIALKEQREAMLRIADNVIGLLPSVTPKQRTGKWINGYCSECGEHAPFWAMASTYHESNFCPNCGADMRGEKDG